MIAGLGTDIVEIGRFKKFSDNSHFLDKIYSHEELAFIKNKPQSLAGNFAAKEAVSKALGTGFSGISPKELEILRNEKGCPFCKLSGNAKALADNLGIKNIFVSISHSKNYATATAIAERE